MSTATTPLPGTRTLARRALLNVRAAGPVTIACETGELWVTQDGYPEDVILAGGEQFTTQGTAPTLIEALADARLRVVAAAEVGVGNVGVGAGGGAATSAGARTYARSGVRAGAAPCWGLAAMFDKARQGMGFARVNTGGLITSAMASRGDAWRGLRDSGCA